MNNLSKLNTLLLIVLIGFISLASSCGPDEPIEEDPTTGNLKLTMDFFNDGAEMKWGEVNYTNAAGNEYAGYEVEFFISRVTIYQGGTATILNKYHNSHYFDNKIDETLTWNIADDIEQGSFDSLAFTFGFTAEDNKSLMFSNLPESAMEWPQAMGGGYHAMKLNGKWKTSGDTLSNFNFHVGPGSRDGIDYDNSFVASIPASSFSISMNNTTTINLRMNIDNWFENPTNYDHNFFGGSIMKNQDAQDVINENGWNVFSRVQ